MRAPVAIAAFFLAACAGDPAGIGGVYRADDLSWLATFGVTP